MKENYHKKMMEMIDQITSEGKLPSLLLHTCCAPCSTTVIERLSQFFSITVFYYNPNIEPYDEYLKRKKAQIRFLKEYSKERSISFLDCDWQHEDFSKITKGLEQEREGGLRCHACYRLRLQKTAEVAKEKGFDYFTTSLTISPYKNSQIINQIGKELEHIYHISYLYSDFKKEDGYLKSIQNSKKYRLYRQDYCGCHYSHVLHSNEEKESTI